MRTVIDEFGVDNIDDAGRLFNSVYTKIMFKDYLEDNNMKVCELQVIINDVYLSFVNNVTSNKRKTKKSSTKSSSRKTTVGSDTIIISSMKQSLVMMTVLSNIPKKNKTKAET